MNRRTGHLRGRQGQEHALRKRGHRDRHRALRHGADDSMAPAIGFGSELAVGVLPLRARHGASVPVEIDDTETLLCSGSGGWKSISLPTSPREGATSYSRTGPFRKSGSRVCSGGTDGRSGRKGGRYLNTPFLEPGRNMDQQIVNKTSYRRKHSARSRID